MRLIDEISVIYNGIPRYVRLYAGDLAAIPLNETVDLLVVSAFPDDYDPTPTSLIGALERNGISVSSLAADKAVDLRQFSSCWLSQVIPSVDAGFKRILCFEPLIRGSAAEVVGDVFRSLVPFAAGTPAISQVAMPLLASGDQGEPKSVMLEAILDAALHWLQIGLPIDCLKIVDRDPAGHESLVETFASVKQRFMEQPSLPPQTQGWDYDLFVSYSHVNKDAVDFLVAEILRLEASFRVFVDRMELMSGAPWQQHVLEALDRCRTVMTVLSPAYLESKICKEEFNIALYRHRESAGGILLPLYLQTATLPTYMKLIHYMDVREIDRSKIRQVSKEICDLLRH